MGERLDKMKECEDEDVGGERVLNVVDEEDKKII
jgi:hypothetical protein